MHQLARCSPILLLVCLFLSALGLAAADDEVTCEVRLRNGSIIKGTFPKLEQVVIKVKYGDLKVPVKDLRSLNWGDPKKQELDTLVATAGTYRGWIEELQPIEVDTGFGILKIPTTSIKMLRLSRRGDTIGDDFSSGNLDAWTTYGAASWQSQDGKLVCTPSGNYDGILFDEELEGAYTVEAEVANTNAAGMLWQAADGTTAAALWLGPGSARVFTGSPWYNQQVTAWNTPTQGNQTVQVKLEVSDGTTTIYVNDHRLGEVNTPRKSGKIGFFCINQVSTFDNVVITR